MLWILVRCTAGGAFGWVRSPVSSALCRQVQPPNPVILALLASLGTAFAAHIRHAKRVGYNLTTFDTDSGLHKTKNAKTLFSVRSRLVSA